MFLDHAFPQEFNIPTVDCQHLMVVEIVDGCEIPYGHVRDSTIPLEVHVQGNPCMISSSLNISSPHEPIILGFLGLSC